MTYIEYKFIREPIRPGRSVSKRGYIILKQVDYTFHYLMMVETREEAVEIVERLTKNNL